MKTIIHNNKQDTTHRVFERATKIVTRLRLSEIFFRPSAVVMLFYSLYVVGVLSVRNYDPTSFIYIGTRFLYHDPGGSIGYDGQFFYYIAFRSFQCLIIVNVIAITVGTEAASRLMRLFDVNPWYALTYGFYIGQLYARALLRSSRIMQGLKGFALKWTLEK
jgi:hypothetical protein